MKYCSIPLCSNDSNKRPDLRYFPLPRNVNLREEWLEVIGVKDHRGQNLSICEKHFNELDFKAGKKELKPHAVPVLAVGVCDDLEFVPDVPVDVVETVKPEVDQIQAAPAYSKRKRSEEEKIQPEQTPETECETGRRPSRRAALVAAKKIFNTVRNYGVKDEEDPEDPHSQPPTPKPPATPRTQVKIKKSRNHDLDMFCEEEELSESQAHAQRCAQNDFNLAMKNMRELTACKVKIIQTGPNPVNFNVSVNVFEDESTPVKVGLKNNSRVKSNVTKVLPVPVFLTKVAKSKIPIIYL